MNKIVLLTCLYSLLVFPQTGEISGRVYDTSDKSVLVNCNILVLETDRGTSTDDTGVFKLTLPYGNYTIRFTYLGYEPYEKKILLNKSNSSEHLIIGLSSVSIPGGEVTITADQIIPSTVSQGIKPKDIERMPTIYNDVLRAVQVLPGVSTNNELSSGYNVRGGNFDDNLIYLNGFEIYRPFLLRQGVEENKSLINPGLVSSLRFYNGSFPAVYGDKMSSALDVNYNIKRIDGFSGSINADLLNTGIIIKNNFKGFKTGMGFRYANPGLFLNALQTSGEYKPHFLDFQFTSSYLINERTELELFFLHADNDFDLTPANWLGGFGGYFRGDYRALEIIYQGERTYSFRTRLFGTRFTHQINNNIIAGISASRYATIESETSNIYSDFYYMPVAQSSEKEYLRSAQEYINNYLDLTSYEIIPQVQIKTANHLFTAGVNLRLTEVSNKVSEQFTETNDSLIRNFPDDRIINQNFSLDSYSAFIQDDININDLLFVNAGIRLNYYDYNREMLYSPRISIVYPLSNIHSFSLGFGYYFQPPYYAELRNKENVNTNKILSQKALHYSAGWEFAIKEKLKFNVEAYYRHLDDLIPYYIDREKTEYLTGNYNEGYAFGIDLMVQGEIIEGMNSWIGYGYLDTKEKPKAGGGYTRRLTDQTHTFQLFLQDRIKKHPNWQSHFRLLFGSGYLFNFRDLVTDEANNQRYIRVSMTNLQEYFMYFRADMGLSAAFDISDVYELVIVAEVLNLFNHRNYASYRFVQVSKDIPAPFAVPSLLSSRFVNVSLELKF